VDNALRNNTILVGFVVAAAPPPFSDVYCGVYAAARFRANVASNISYRMYGQAGWVNIKIMKDAHRGRWVNENNGQTMGNIALRADKDGADLVVLLGGQFSVGTTHYRISGLSMGSGQMCLGSGNMVSSGKTDRQ